MYQYRRRRKFKARFPKTSRSFRKKYPKTNYALKALKYAKYVKSLLNVEYKYHDTSIATSPTNSGEVLLLNGLVTGDTSTTRDGDSVKYVNLTYKATLAWGGTNTSEVVRIMLVQYYNPQGANLLWSDLIVSQDVNALRVLNKTKGVKVHMDKKYTLSAQVPSIPLNFFRKMQLKTKYLYSSNYGDYRDIANNGLYLFIISNTAANHPSINGRTRMRYLDN